MQRPSDSHCSFQPLQPARQPFLLAADGLGIIAALHALAQRIGQTVARTEQVRRLVIDFGVLPVPQDVAPFGIQHHDALRQAVQRLAQPLLGQDRSVLRAGQRVTRIVVVPVPCIAATGPIATRAEFHH